MSRRASRLRAVWAALAAALLLVSADRMPRSGRVTAAIGSAAPADPRLPDFALFGWVSPPPESTTEARIAEYADAGFDVALPAWADSGRREDNLARFAWAAAHGVRCIAWDRRLNQVRFPDPLEALDSVVADCKNHPGFLAYYFEDEPVEKDFPLWARFQSALAERDSSHVSFNNLAGRQSFLTRDAWMDYTRNYVEVVKPAVLCNDHYDFTKTGDRGLFVENVAGLASIAREYGLPFWLIVQLIEHGNFRGLTEGELRWQLGMGLAYGARGLGLFTYWTPAPDPNWNWQYGLIDWAGRRTSWYSATQSLLPITRAIGLRLAAATWLATEHAGSVPLGGTAFAPDDWVRALDGRAALGSFASGAAERLLLVTNADSASERTLALTFGSVSRVSRLALASGNDGVWAPLGIAPTAGGARLDLTLAAGEFVLLRLEGEDGTLATGSAPVLHMGPVPARGQLSLTVQEVSRHGRLEILDSSGRRMWSRPLAAGATLRSWDGAREGGGRVTAGVDFVRVEDDRGVTAPRFAWLGH